MNLIRFMDRLKRHEGLRLYPYTDTTGNLTIGYGRNLTGKGINMDEAESMLISDLFDARDELFTRFLWVENLDDVRQEVLIEMTFNLGISGLSKFKNTLAAVKRGDYAAAAKGMRASLWARQVKGRAQLLATAMETGVFPDA